MWREIVLQQEADSLRFYLPASPRANRRGTAVGVLMGRHGWFAEQVFTRWRVEVRVRQKLGPWQRMMLVGWSGQNTAERLKNAAAAVMERMRRAGFEVDENGFFWEQ